MSTASSVVVVTGASGLLGRAILAHLRESGAFKEVIGTAFSRSGGGLVKVDLTDAAAVAAFIRETRPAFLVHSAAQRFPDKVDADAEGAREGIQLTFFAPKIVPQIALKFAPKSAPRLSFLS